ncbi:glycosyl hydrolase 115 family protein [Amycolatopsis sp. H20-H5]|uniref:glycosyl hydrolase 115 family protein n=1 Tax=Amycolatopsis sp. H20-H5 TaxID=3046309 RepID=UPI002DB58E97|nr:glycosyl hydrolase 115 family protein [Amycolatopsis sp. H20-H5]MEC3981805.1 glycosyl hydrolase 115 family protein [Amycolatopsis sp. H20-H5]
MMAFDVRRRDFLRLLAVLGAGAAQASGVAEAAPSDWVAGQRGGGSFPLVSKGKAATLVVSSADHPGVQRVARDLQADIERVTGVRPELLVDRVAARGPVVLIGTLGHSPLVDELVAARELDVTGIAGKWETSLSQVVGGRLVLTGSDQRGVIYGAYELSRQIGVSPWYWWADVPARQADELHVRPGRQSLGTPYVKYRGFFLNDENPALGTWAPAHFGPGHAPGYPNGFNHEFFAKVFETMLRLKANYLWPAVWGRAFAEDDPLNHATAKEYGIIMGTSHEAPMMRGIEEWNRHAVPAVRDAAGNVLTPGHDPYGGTGEWSFRRNAGAVKAYWAEGIRRMVREDFEGVVTLGMRGNGDVSLPDGDGIDLMREILATEREILARETGRDVTEVPQVWTLYKEVQRYWAQGLRPADDVIVVFTDDNWGNIRKHPDPALPPRAGGYGLYYHFDYVGGGRSYKWVDTSLLANTWEQLNQAVAYGNDRLWVANVGDLKGNELPLHFFLDYAWNPAAWPVERLSTWEFQFAETNFGASAAAAVAEVLHTYARLQARRKPELLNRLIGLDAAKDPATDPTAITYDDQASPFSLVHYQELQRVTVEWQDLAARAEKISVRLPAAYRDAYYELVLYEVKASANLYALRQAEFTNILYAGQGRASANELAAVAEARFADDLALAEKFDNGIADGKWRGFQTQPHIDYGDVARYGPNAPWQQPERNNVALPDVLFPAVRRVDPPLAADLGVAVDGSGQSWPGSTDRPVLPEFSPYQSAPPQYIDVFNRGRTPFRCEVTSGAPWVLVEPRGGRVDKELRMTVRINWARAPKGTSTVPIRVSGPGREVTVAAVVHQPDLPVAWRRGFIEAGGYVSMEAEHCTANVGTASAAWRRIPDLGRTGAGMTPFPVTTPSRPPGAGPRLEYRMTLFTAGTVTLWAYLSPRSNVLQGSGLRYAVSFDDMEPQLVNITKASGADDMTMNRQWERTTSDNVNLTATRHPILAPGPHVLKFWMVDPAVVVQKLVVDTGGLRPSYLGPPESRRLGAEPS